MINYYKKSKKEFIRCIRRNPFLTKEEWNDYAQKNNLFSAFTLEAHEINDNTLEILEKQNKDTFEFLKSIFVIIPHKPLKFFERIVKMNNEKRRLINTNDR